MSGAIDPCESKLHHEMRVKRVYESPRVTKPYTEAQWAEVLKLGDERFHLVGHGGGEISRAVLKARFEPRARFLDHDDLVPCRFFKRRAVN